MAYRAQREEFFYFVLHLPLLTICVLRSLSREARRKYFCILLKQVGFQKSQFSVAYDAKREEFLEDAQLVVKCCTAYNKQTLPEYVQFAEYVFEEANKLIKKEFP